MNTENIYCYPTANFRRGALGYIRNRKTEEKIIQNRKKIWPKSKTADKTVKN